jgi:hypothetical protein
VATTRWDLNHSSSSSIKLNSQMVSRSLLSTSGRDLAELNLFSCGRDAIALCREGGGQAATDLFLPFAASPGQASNGWQMKWVPWQLFIYSGYRWHESNRQAEVDEEHVTEKPGELGGEGSLLANKTWGPLDLIVWPWECEGGGGDQMAATRREGPLQRTH